MRQAVFLDRDGTIIEENDQLKAPEQVEFLPHAIEALLKLQRCFRLFLISNQCGVESGVLTTSEAASINGGVMLQLYHAGVFVEDLYACPHARRQCCHCHKPEPLVMRQAAARYGLDLSRCWSVGDHPHDAQLGVSAGGRGVYLLSGHGCKHREQVPDGIPIAADLTEATRIIFAGMGAELVR